MNAWISSRNPRHGNVTEELYRFETSSTDTEMPPNGLVQGVRSTMKPSCMQPSTVRALLTYVEQLLSRAERNRLLAESIVKITPPGGKGGFLLSYSYNERSSVVDVTERTKNKHVLLWTIPHQHFQLHLEAQGPSG